MLMNSAYMTFAGIPAVTLRMGDDIGADMIVIHFSNDVLSQSWCWLKRSITLCIKSVHLMCVRCPIK